MPECQQMIFEWLGEIKFKWKDKLKLAKRAMSTTDYYIKNNELIIFSAEVEK